MKSQNVHNEIMAITASSLEIVKENKSSGLKRTQILITNIGTGVVTLVKASNVIAVANQGIILQPQGTYFESSETGFTCWQGAIQAVTTINGDVAIVEMLENV
jgi:hypothetical protein